MGVVHRRRSLRLPHYDYSRAGYYFITITAHNRAHLFGEIVGGEMVLNGAGRMIETWYRKLEKKFPNIKNHERVVMPNHIHFIVEIIQRADPRVRPLYDPRRNTKGQTHGSAPTGECNTQSHVTIGGIIQWFKTMTTNAYIHMVKNGMLPPFHKRIWQRNYYEHVIRDDADYVRIAEYIVNNPLTWANDRLSTHTV